MELNKEQVEELTDKLKEASKAYAKQPPYLLIVFVLLKAFGVISWSWLATIAIPVLLPFAIVLALLIATILVVGIVFVGILVKIMIGEAISKYRRKKRR